jgi:hypothetical protein
MIFAEMDENPQSQQVPVFLNSWSF